MSFALLVSALQAELAGALPRAKKLGLSPSEAWNALVVAQLRGTLKEIALARGRDVALLATGRLFASVPGFEADARAAVRRRLLAEIQPNLAQQSVACRELPVEAFGQLYESLLSARPADGQHGLRKRTGSYYTPEALTRIVAERALDALAGVLGPDGFSSRPLRIVDPALGAGAFLVQAAREVARRSGRLLADVARLELFGADVSPLALAVAGASLWLLCDTPGFSLEAAGARLREGDALCTPAAAKTLGRRGVDFFELAGNPAGFDLVLGNPPWVAFAGRATQPLSPELREHYRHTFRAFRGYPTLHALFVELGASLAPQGVVALLIPSPVADLEGYRHVRSALSATHAVQEPLLELGQDAFESVTQPCFALVAAPRREPSQDPERAFVLAERRRAAGAASEVQVPSALGRLAGLPRLPSELFGEMGLQTSSAVTRQLLHRGSAPPPEFSYPLLEGRNIAEFALKPPRLFLKPDRTFLAEHRCRLREVSEYSRVKLVVRQTAAITIAAAHDGTPFRNSLLAGFESSEFPYQLLLGLLNSTLYRALHLSGRRDARQGAFPQVKIGHLRALPAPPAMPARSRIAELAAQAGKSGLTAELRRALDTAVFDLFRISPEEGVEIASFVSSLSPRAGLTAPLA
jgi:N-6 DNA Methylase/TaqI-like C-terminal specificity domain